MISIGRIKNKTIERLLFMLVSLIYISGLLYKVKEMRSDFSFKIIIILIISIYTLRHYMIFKLKMKSLITAILMVLIELILISYLYFYTNTLMSDLIYMMFVTDIVLFYTPSLSIPLALIGYLGYYSLSVIKLEIHFGLDVIATLVSRGISFSGFVFVLAYLKGTLNKNVTMQTLMNEISEKNEALEEMVLVKERNRISSEMHDTVGHTLTTSIVELEAAKLLFETDPQMAMEKLDLGCSQIRKSINDIRTVVKKIDSGRSIMDFIPSIESLVQDVRKHTSINIVVDMEVCNLLAIQENTLYYAIQESITNSIKHGLANEILVTSSVLNDQYQLQVVDNGVGCNNIIIGFGLHKMSQRISGLGGLLSLDSNSKTGFVVTITLPIQT